MLHLKQITPENILLNQDGLREYFFEELRVDYEKAWMTEMELMQRFQLLKFSQLAEAEIMSLSWNPRKIERLVKDTFQNIVRYLPFRVIHVTIVPALPFPFFQDQPHSLWTNAFTNGPENIIMAIPPNPDTDFFQYLLAHECHHAFSENPIYNLSLSEFTLEEWFKMEGTAEYFSLSLYPDKRWWKDYFTKDAQVRYWNECKEYLKSTDDRIKAPLCFGSTKRNIPVFSGYSFAFKLVSNYVLLENINHVRELFAVDPSSLTESYKINLA